MNFLKSFTDAAKTIAAPAALAAGLAGCGFSHTTYERAPAPQRTVVVETRPLAQCAIYNARYEIVGYRPC